MKQHNIISQRQMNEVGQLLPLTAVFMGLFAISIFSLGQLGNKAVNIANAEAVAEMVAYSVKLQETPESALTMAKQVAKSNSAELIKLKNQPDGVLVEIERNGHRVSVKAGK